LNKAEGEKSLPCQIGLCQGQLPGCTEVNNKKIHYRPKVLLNFTRQYFYNPKNKGKFHGLMKEALAYAFSTLPEMVDVVVKEMKENGGHLFPASSNNNPGTQAPPTNWWKTNSPTSPPQQQPSVQWPSRPVTQAPAPAPQVLPSPSVPNPGPNNKDVNDAFSKWWSGAGDTRRLSSNVGSKEELPAQLEGHQVVLDFKHGVPFVIDRPLIEMMLQNGYFKGLEDVEDDHSAEKGPLEISGFYVDSGAPIELDGDDAPYDIAEGDVVGSARVPSVLSLTLACTSGMGVIFLGAFVRGRWKARSYHRGDYYGDGME